MISLTKERSRRLRKKLRVGEFEVGTLVDAWYGVGDEAL